MIHLKGFSSSCASGIVWIETTDTTRITMATQVKKCFSSYNLIVYVKDEGGNLSTFAWTFTSMVKCTDLALATPWQGYYFGHAFNKACEYALNGTNVYVDFHEVKYLKAT